MTILQSGLIAASVLSVLFGVLFILWTKQKGKAVGVAAVRLFYPTTGAKPVFIPRARLAANATAFKDDARKLDVPLSPGMLMSGEVWIDAEQGRQIAYRGGQWMGPDGRTMLVEWVKRHAAALQTRGIDFTKFMWPTVILIGIIVLGAVGLAAMAVNK